MLISTRLLLLLMFDELLADIAPGKVVVAQITLEPLPESCLHLLQNGGNLLGVNEMAQLLFGKEYFLTQGGDDLLEPVRKIRRQSGGIYRYGKAHLKDHLSSVASHGTGAVIEFQYEAVGKGFTEKRSFCHRVYAID